MSATSRSLRYLTINREKFQHGTHARYVAGCRCALCRKALCLVQRDRQRKVEAARAEVKPNPLPPDFKTILRAGAPVKVRMCNGTGGRPCVKGLPGLAGWVTGAWLKNGGEVCTACVDRAVVWNGLVSAERARKHLEVLSRKGIGYKAVAAACDVANSCLGGIRCGTVTRIRAHTERKILAVDEGARADGSQVPAKRSFGIIDELRTMGFTWEQLSRELGFSSRFAAGALRHGKAAVGHGETYVRKAHERTEVLARTALRIEKLYRRVVAGEIRPQRWKVDGAETWKLVDELRKGFAQKDLAERLGVHTATLRNRARQVRPTTRDAVRRLYDELLEAHREGGPMPEGWQTSAHPVTPMGAEEWVKGGWSVARRTSKAAKKREEKELRKLARPVRLAPAAQLPAANTEPDPGPAVRPPPSERMAEPVPDPGGVAGLVSSGRGGRGP